MSFLLNYIVYDWRGLHFEKDSGSSDLLMILWFVNSLYDSDEIISMSWGLAIFLTNSTNVGWGAENFLLGPLLLLEGCICAIAYVIFFTLRMLFQKAGLYFLPALIRLHAPLKVSDNHIILTKIFNNISTINRSRPNLRSARIENKRLSFHHWSTHSRKIVLLTRLLK